MTDGVAGARDVDRAFQEVGYREQSQVPVPRPLLSMRLTLLLETPPCLGRGMTVSLTIRWLNHLQMSIMINAKDEDLLVCLTDLKVSEGN